MQEEQIFVMMIDMILFKNFEFYQADLRDFDDCKNVVVDMDVVFHVEVKWFTKESRTTK